MTPLTRWLWILMVIPFCRASAEPAQNAQLTSPVVKMAPYEVKEDPLRTWGIHASFVISLLARIKSGTIFAVQPGSSAANAGLHPGDKIVSFNGTPVEKMSIFSFISKAKAALADGTFVDLGVSGPGANEVQIVRFRFSPEVPRVWPSVHFGQVGRTPSGLPLIKRTPDIWPAASWSQAGNGTPRAALESVFFDREHGDVDGLAGLLAFEPAAKKKLDAIFLSLPAAGRTYYGSAERLMATLINTETLPASIRILKEAMDSTDEASLQARLRFFDDSYHQTYEASFHLAKAAGGWRWSISAAAVKEYADYYAHVPFVVSPVDSSKGLPWLFFSI